MEHSLNDLTDQVIACAIEVHRFLGPGLLESAYERCLSFEVAQRGLLVETQKPLPLHYKGMRIDCGYRLDLLVCERLIVEVKAVRALEPIHEAQVLSYLKLSGHSIGLLINFNVRLLSLGVRRLINGYDRP